MDSKRHIPLSEAISAAQDWWRDAGVDCDFVDEPHNWLAEAEKPAEQAAPPVMATKPAVPEEPELPPLGGDRAQWPKSSAEFAEWWLAEASLEIAGTGPRVAPRGTAEAELMILLAMPEAGDAESLLSGPHGKLIAAMLDAMGIAEDNVYLATALPCHARHPDWQMLAEREHGEIVRYHVKLAAPKRLLVLGREMLPLFGHDPAQGSVTPRQIALDGVDMAALAAVGPDTLLHERRFRAALWQAWLDWRD